MVAKRDGKGVTGISYDADYGFYSRVFNLLALRLLDSLVLKSSGWKGAFAKFSSL